jgi:hypothetical protein
MAVINTVEGTTNNDVIDLDRGNAYQPGKLVASLSGAQSEGQPPVAQLIVNGQVVATAAIWATVQSGASQLLSYTIPAGTVVTSVGIAYVNDLFKSDAEDRNLYVNSISLNGMALSLGQGTYTPEAHPVQPGERLMAWNGPLIFQGAPVMNAMNANTLGNSLTIDGREGVDTFIYDGRFVDYTLAYGANNSMTVASKSGGFGTDSLFGIERIVFDDQGSYGGNSPLVIQQNGNNRVIDGGSGIDAVAFTGSRSEYTISRTSGGNYEVTHTGFGITDVLVNVERVSFSNGNYALDVNGNGGMAYRLYQAAFDRTPDVGGFGFQMTALDNGQTIWQVADNFLRSPEFQATYGNLSNEAFVRQLYVNVLDRQGEEGGVQFHTANLNSGATARWQTLVQFSESPENQANLIGTIQQGMLYTV